MDRHANVSGGPFRGDRAAVGQRADSEELRVAEGMEQLARARVETEEKDGPPAGLRDLEEMLPIGLVGLAGPGWKDLDDTPVELAQRARPGASC